MDVRLTIPRYSRRHYNLFGKSTSFVIKSGTRNFFFARTKHPILLPISGHFVREVLFICKDQFLHFSYGIPIIQVLTTSFPFLLNFLIFPITSPETIILLNGFRFSSLVIRRTEVRLLTLDLLKFPAETCVSQVGPPGTRSFPLRRPYLSSLTAVLGLPLPCFLLVDPVSLIFLI